MAQQAKARPDVGLDGSPEELAARLASLAAPPDALSTLESLAAAVFPKGLGSLAQLSWEVTTTPPFPREMGEAQPRLTDEARLRLVELRYRTLVEQIPAVTFMAVLGEGQNEVYVSPYIEALLGFTQKEWLENPILWFTQIHPEDRNVWVDEFARGIRTGGPFRAECRLITRDDRIVWVRGEARLIKDELGRPQFLQGVAFDITEAKRAEEQQLRQAVSRTEARYRDLVERLGAVFWEAEAPTGRFLFVSQGAERIFGVAADRFLKDPLFFGTIVHGEDRDRVLREWADVLRKAEDAVLEFRAVRADGSVVWLQSRVHFPASHGAEQRMLGIVIDITERKRSEEELAELYEAALDARREAEVANRAKDQFLATMSHELRTPVNAVLGWSDILEMGAGGVDMQERALVAIKRAARAQSQMIEDLLDVSRIVTGKFRLEVKRVDLVTVVDSALETVRLAADAKRIELVTEMSDAPVTVLGDSGRLRQVVSNLLTNAVKFTPEKGRIEVRLAENGERVCLTVKDSGVGIEPGFLPFAFDRFRQADNSSTRTQGGLGLGLAIVRHLTELHGGTVKADSAGLGLGATFTVELPLDTHAGAEGMTHSAAVFGGVQDPVAYLKDARILLVDDDTDTLEVLGAVLARAGAEVATASSAAEAMRILGRRTFDLLVSDISMPDQDGFAFLRSVRSLDNRNARIPVAALTAHAREEDRQDALNRGFQAHLVKPMDNDLTLTVLGRLVHDARVK
jgi:PAS domain S-box-containing protein